MSDKPLAFLVYALFGSLLALSPALLGILGHHYDHRRTPFLGSNARKWIRRLAGGLALIFVIWVASPSVGIVAASIFLAAWVAWRADVRSPTAVFFIGSMLIASTKMIWWRPPAETFSPALLAACVAVFAVALELMNSSQAFRNRSADRIALIAFLCLSAFFSFSTGLYRVDEILFTTWHHWSSYVGPAELIWAGARIFYDAPAQYGLGPTMLIAATCAIDCWAGMYYIVGIFNVLYAAAIGYIALQLLGQERATGISIVALIATLMACFFYTAYPPSLATPSITPSTGGMRFLPCAALVAYLLFVADKAWSWRQKAFGHAIWTVGFFWAPESAFHVTFVWWPYYLWRSGAAGPKGWPGIAAAARHAGVLGLIATSAAAIFAAAYYATFAVLPTLDGVLAYVLYPPGPIPFDFHGAFVFLGGVLLMTFGCLVIQAYRNDQAYLNRSIPVTLALYAVASYYLGRSVDNNLLNIMPFIVTALFVVVTLPRLSALGAIGSAAICCVIALTLGFGWDAHWGPAIRQGYAFGIGPSVVSATFDFGNPDARAALDRRENPRNPAVHSSDVQDAIAYIQANYREPVTLAAPPLVLIRSRAQPWSALHVPANFWFMPEASRRLFIERTMLRFNRPGWVVIQTDASDQIAEGGRNLVRDIEAVYARDVSQQFGSYRAIRYLPKNH